MKYRIGIVGCGGIAHRHIEGYRAVAGDLGEVVAGCDISRKVVEDFCEAYDLRFRFTDVNDMIESGEVDVISLLTPPAVRSEVIFPAIEYGIHLLVEKPFAENLSDAVLFVEAAKQAGTVLAVNQQLRFMPDILMAKDIINSGSLGEIRFIAHDQFQNRIRTSGWRKDEERLEISIFSIHLLDRIRWLMGHSPEGVNAVTRYWSSDVRGETFASLTIQFVGDAVGTMISNWHSLVIPECRLRVDGTGGSLLSVKKAVLSDQCQLMVQRLEGEAEHKDCSLQNAFTLAMGRSMERLLQGISSGNEPPHSGRDNLETMAIVDAAYLSASRGGTKVEIGEIWQK